MAEMFTVESQFSRAVLPLFDEQQVAYLLVRLKAAREAGMQRAALNWSLLIDRSGSMHGEKLDSLKRALIDVVLRPSVKLTEA